MINKTIVISLMLILNQVIFSQPNPHVVYFNYPPIADIEYLNIPERPENAYEGSEFVNLVAEMNLIDREKAIVKEILAGNVPSFSRELRKLQVNKTVNGKSYNLILLSTCDYMAIGSNEDYFYTPLTPSTAQYLADRINCTLPTKKMVDIIYSSAEIKLHPQPIPPSDKMTTIPVFEMHTDSIKYQINQLGIDRSDKNIIAGHKKDVIISNKIYSTDKNFDRVVIYGWHRSINNPIQPVYNGHIAMYADYSHGIRFISNMAIIDTDTSNVRDVLKDPTLSSLLSDEGVIKKTTYPESDFLTSLNIRSKKNQIGFNLKQNYPNPFNPSTKITYQVPKSTNVEILVFDVLGREIEQLVNGQHGEGIYDVEFSGNNINSGVYYYRLIAKNQILTNKMLLLK